MSDGPSDAPPLIHARAAGLLYLAIIVLGLAGEFLVRASLVVPGDPATTAARIADSEQLFRLGFAADTVMALCDVGLAVLLFIVLEPVSRTLALMATAFRLVQTAIIGLNLLSQHQALMLLDPASALGAYSDDQRAALALLALETQRHGYDLALLFFGAGNLILGGLVWRAAYLPRAIGALLIAAGAVYLAGGYLLFLAPHAAARFEPAYLVCLIAEASFCLWLLLRGVDRARWTASVGLSAQRVSASS